MLIYLLMQGNACVLLRKIIESIYAVVLDYKSLIDANWHYLYTPKTDWAKFCKICIFLLNVRNYISKIVNEKNQLEGQDTTICSKMP